MTLIEGVGDEVTVFVCLLVVFIVLALAWLSTGVTNRPFISVILLDGRIFQHYLSRLRGRRAVITASTEGASASAPAGSTGPEAVAAGRGTHIETPSPAGGEHVYVEAESSCGESSPTASTPESEGFVHLERSGSHVESTSPAAHELLAQREVPPGGESELRRRRLAFFSGSVGGAGSEPAPDSTQQTSRDPPRDAPHDSPRDLPRDPPRDPPAARPDVGDGFTPLDGHIRIRLKYLDDRHRWVQARPEETVGQFKRAHFGAELGENTMIRFIYNGRELSRDGQSLAAYNVADESVIHCLVRQGDTHPHPASGPPGGVAFDMGSLVFPLFGLILALIWYSRFTYKQYFNTMSTLTLLAISFLFVVALVASLRMHDEPEAAEAD